MSAPMYTLLEKTLNQNVDLFRNKSFLEIFIKIESVMVNVDDFKILRTNRAQTLSHSSIAHYDITIAIMRAIPVVLDGDNIYLIKDKKPYNFCYKTLGLNRGQIKKIMGTLMNNLYYINKDIMLNKLKSIKNKHYREELHQYDTDQLESCLCEWCKLSLVKSINDTESSKSIISSTSGVTKTSSGVTKKFKIKPKSKVTELELTKLKTEFNRFYPRIKDKIDNEHITKDDPKSLQFIKILKAFISNFKVLKSDPNFSKQYTIVEDVLKSLQ